VGAILVERPNRRTNFWKRTIQWLFHQHLVLIEQMVSDKKIFIWEIHIKIFSSETNGLIATKLWWNGHWMAPFQNCVRWSWLSYQDGRQAKSKKKGDEILKLIFWEFTIGSYVKLCWAVAAILVGDRKCRKQMWKGTYQGSFQQSLVEIGSVVSEEKINFKISSDLRPRWPPQPSLI
jgi:hypothetical protein